MGEASPQEGDEVGKKHRNLRFNGSKRAVLFFTKKKIAKRDLVILVHFLLLWGSEEHPMGDKLVVHNLRRVIG